MVVTRKASWSMNISFCAFHPISNSPELRRSFVPASRRTRRCAPGASARARKSAWLVWAASATWRRSFSGSMIGGIPETQEMLDFCGKHNIAADVEVIPIQKVNEAYERLLKSDVKYRFSIDMASLKSE